jgi:hypothetical protein
VHPWLRAAKHAVAISSEAVHVLAASKMVPNDKHEQFVLPNTKEIESKWLL